MCCSSGGRRGQGLRIKPRFDRLFSRLFSFLSLAEVPVRDPFLKKFAERAGVKWSPGQEPARRAQTDSTGLRLERRNRSQGRLEPESFGVNSKFLPQKNTQPESSGLRLLRPLSDQGSPFPLRLDPKRTNFSPGRQMRLSLPLRLQS